MTSDELEHALEHDMAQKEQKVEPVSQVQLARYCLQNAVLSARGAECAIVVCKPPAVVEARQAIQLAMQSLEQALFCLNKMETENV